MDLGGLEVPGEEYWPVGKVRHRETDQILSVLGEEGFKGGRRGEDTLLTIVSTTLNSQEAIPALSHHSQLPLEPL